MVKENKKEIKTITCRNDSSGFKYVTEFRRSEGGSDTLLKYLMTSESFYHGDHLMTKKEFKQNEDGPLLYLDIEGDGDIDKQYNLIIRKNEVKIDDKADLSTENTSTLEVYRDLFETFSERQRKKEFKKAEGIKNAYINQKMDSLNARCDSIIAIKDKEMAALKANYEKKVVEITTKAKTEKKSIISNKAEPIGLKNYMLFYVDITEGKKKTGFRISSKCDMYFEGKTQSFFMGRESPVFDPSIKSFGIHEDKDTLYVVPLMIGPSSYDFSEDSPEAIRKDIAKFSQGKKVYITKPQQWEKGLWFHALWEKKTFKDD